MEIFIKIKIEITIERGLASVSAGSRYPSADKIAITCIFIRPPVFDINVLLPRMFQEVKKVACHSRYFRRRLWNALKGVRECTLRISIA